MKNLISNVNYFLNISERLRTEIYSIDLSYIQKAVLEKYKLGELILLKTLEMLGNNVRDYELPIIHIADDSSFEYCKTVRGFKNVNRKLFNEVLTSLGWCITCYEIEDYDILDSCEYDDDGIVKFYAEETFGELATNLPYLMENISQVAVESGYSLSKYYQISNKRIGQYLCKEQTEHTEITNIIDRCINELNTLFSSSFCVDSTLIDNNLFMIGYFFFDDNINGNGNNEENYNMSFLIICCLINILLDEIEKC